MIKYLVSKAVLVVSIFFGVLFLSTDALAQRDGLGIGISVGEPTGLSIKKFISGSDAIQAGLAWSFRRTSGAPFTGSNSGFLYFHLDYLKHYYLTAGRTGLQIPFYIGIGGFTVLRDDPVLGLRIPLGLAIHFGSLPLDAFFEVVPGLGLAPRTEFYVGYALGGRFYF